MEFFIISLIAALFLVISVGYLVFSVLIFENQKLKYAQKNNLQEDLELATMDQLFNEIKKRDQYPMIIVTTQPSGILVDCFNIPPALSVQVLESSADLVRDKIKKNMGDLDDIE